MVHVPKRGTGPVRFGEGVEHVPGPGPALVPASFYTDEHRYELEREKIFRRTWLIGGRSTEIPTAGDFKVWEAVGETVVISRLKDGGIAAFHNVCQHRGARIVPPRRTADGHQPLNSPTGHCDKVFECPWHGFTYDLQGRVKGVPDRADFDPKELKGLRAPEVAVAEWGGWIWINLSGPASAPPFLDYLGEVADELAPYQMENMILHARRSWDMPVNWKAVVDGFCEVYHVPITHRATIQPDRFSLRDTAITLLDVHNMYVIPFHDRLDEAYETQDHQQFTNTHYLVFPNSIFNAPPRNIQMFVPMPLDAHTTRYEAWHLIQPGGDAEFIAQMDRAWEYFCGVAAEDLYVATEAGATRTSMAYTRNMLNRRESRLLHFHDNVEKMLTD